MGDLNKSQHLNCFFSVDSLVYKLNMDGDGRHCDSHPFVKALQLSPSNDSGGQIIFIMQISFCLDLLEALWHVKPGSAD